MTPEELASALSKMGITIDDLESEESIELPEVTKAQIASTVYDVVRKAAFGTGRRSTVTDNRTFESDPAGHVIQKAQEVQGDYDQLSLEERQFIGELTSYALTQGLND